MISLNDYWRGRKDKFPLAMTPQIEANAQITVDLANHLLGYFELAGLQCPRSPITETQVASGWRPPVVNAVFANQHVLVKLGLWMEHPSATPSWLHVQTVPPGSGNRVFYP